MNSYPGNIPVSKSLPFQSPLQSLEELREDHYRVPTRFQELWIYAFYLFLILFSKIHGEAGTRIPMS